MRKSLIHFPLFLAVSMLLAAGCIATKPVESQNDKNEPVTHTGTVSIENVDVDSETEKEITSADLPDVEPSEPPPPGSAGEVNVQDEVRKQARAREAVDWYRKGLLAKRAGDLKTAADHFRKALELNTEYTEANEKLTDVLIEMGEKSADGDELLEGKKRKIAAEIEAIRRDVRNRTAEAVKLFSGREYEKCIKLLEEALGTIEWQAYDIDFAVEKAQAEEILKEARRQQAALDQVAAEQERIKAQREIADEMKNRAEYRRLLSRKHLDGAREALSKNNFAEASTLVRKVLTRNSLNKDARALESLINHERLIFKREKIALEESIEWSKTFINIRKSAIPLTGIMIFPSREKWASLTQKRFRRIQEVQKVFERSDQAIRIQDIIDNTKVSSLTFPEQDILKAIRTIMTAFNDVVPIVVSPSVMIEVGNQKVFMDIRKELSLGDVLDLLMDRLGGGQYSYTIRDEAILIMKRDEDEERRMQIYPVQDMLRKLQDFEAPDLNVGSEDLFEGGSGADIGGDFGDEDDDVFSEVGTRRADGRGDFWDPISTEDSISDLVTSTIDPGNWNIQGKAPHNFNSLNFRRGDMFIYASEKIHSEILELLAQLRRTEDVLVTIEARFLNVSEDIAEEVGVDFRGNPTLWDVLRGGKLNFTDRFLEGFMTDIDELSVLNMSGSGTRERRPTTGGTAEPLLSTSGIWFTKRSDGYALIENAAGDAEIVYLHGGIPSGDTVGIRTENVLDEALAVALARQAGPGLRAGFELNMGSVSINFILNAIEKLERTAILAAPKITTFNRQRAYIAIVNEQSLIVGWEPGTASSSDSPATVDPIPKILRSGIVLDIRPTVTYDRKYVILEVRAFSTDAQIYETRNFDLTPPAKVSESGVWLIQPTILVPIDMPMINSRNIRTTVMVPDDGTVLLGGLAELEERTGESGMPVLSKIPVLGFFFRRKGLSKNQRCLLIIIHAKITLASEREKETMEE